MKDLRPGGGDDRRLRVVAVLLLAVLIGVVVWGLAFAVALAVA